MGMGGLGLMKEQAVRSREKGNVPGQLRKEGNNHMVENPEEQRVAEQGAAKQGGQTR